MPPSCAAVACRRRVPPSHAAVAALATSWSLAYVSEVDARSTDGTLRIAVGTRDGDAPGHPALRARSRARIPGRVSRAHAAGRAAGDGAGDPAVLRLRHSRHADRSRAALRPLVHPLRDRGP